MPEAEAQEAGSRTILIPPEQDPQGVLPPSTEGPQQPDQQQPLLPPPQYQPPTVSPTPPTNVPPISAADLWYISNIM